jgi:cation transport ATPase
MLPSVVLAAGVPLGTGVAALILSALVVPGRRTLALLSQLPVVLSTGVVGASVVLTQASQSATALLAVNVVSTATQALLLRWAFEAHRRSHRDAGRDRGKYVYDALVAAHVRRALRILVQVALFLTALGALASGLLLGRALDVALAVAAVVSSFAVVPLWLAFGWATERVEDEVAASGATLVSSDALDVAMRLEVLVVAGRSATLTVEPTVAMTSIVGRREDETRFTEADLGALVIAAQEVAPRSPLRTALRQAFAGRAEKLRQATFHPGLGVIAERANGQRLLVGSRALMLTHHISTARADAAERTPGSRLVYVALANRLVGYITLEEPPRQTARPALLRLLDAGIEPVLVSAETREVCEALAETLDLAHIRPEVAHEDRPRELATFTQAGVVVGVVGDPVDDADLLTLGHLAIELPHEDTVLPPRFACSVRMGSRDLTGAAVLLCESHALARSERRALIAVLLPAALAALAVSFGVAPPLIAPLGALAAAAIVLSPVVFPTSNRASYGL